MRTTTVTRQRLVNMHSYPPDHRYGPSSSGPIRSPPTNRVPAGSPHARYAMGRPSTPSGKRPLSPGPDELDMNKHAKMSASSRRPSPPGNRSTSQRPSPIPFRQQPTSHSPSESRQADNANYPPSPPTAIPTSLPPHPRPTGLSGHPTGPGAPGMLPPMASRSPPSAVDDDRHRSSGSVSPPRSKRDIVLPARSPPRAKGTLSPSSSYYSHLLHSS